MEPAVLEAVFQRWNYDNNIKKVISVDKMPAVSKGENFLSIVSRLTVEVVLGNGKRATKHFILKETPKEEFTLNICKMSGIFKLETITYTIALRGMESLMEEFQDTDDLLWCQLIHYDPYNSMLLEDLRDSGYKVVKRQFCLDLNHSVLAIRSLARFHGMSKILEKRAIITKHDHLPLALIAQTEIIRSFFYNGYQALSRGMRDHWGEEWADIAEKLKIPEKVIIEKMLTLGKMEETRFNVLNHGDCWSNNLMFKYDWRNEPISVRFLDFQGPHYNSPAIDLTYFMHLSIEPSIRRKHFDDLLEHYHQSLISTLCKYQYNETKPTIEELKKEMERVSFFGLSMFAIRHAVLTTDKTDAMDLEKIFTTGGEEGVNTQIYDDQALINRMGPDLKYIVQTFTL